MSPNIWALLSYFLYAVQAGVLATYLCKYQNSVLLFFIYISALPIVLIRVLFSTTVVWPNGKDIIIVFAVGVVYYLADNFMVHALGLAEATPGKSYVMTIGMMSLTMPLWIAVLSIATGRKMNIYHLVSFLSGAVMLFSALKANTNSGLTKPDTQKIEDKPVSPNVDSSH